VQRTVVCCHAELHAAVSSTERAWKSEGGDNACEDGHVARMQWHMQQLGWQGLSDPGGVLKVSTSAIKRIKSSKYIYSIIAFAGVGGGGQGELRAHVRATAQGRVLCLPFFQMATLCRAGNCDCVTPALLRTASATIV
jgi:hypothetical protein